MKKKLDTLIVRYCIAEDTGEPITMEFEIHDEWFAYQHRWVITRNKGIYSVTETKSGSVLQGSYEGKALDDLKMSYKGRHVDKKFNMLKAIKEDFFVRIEKIKKTAIEAGKLKENCTEEDLTRYITKTVKENIRINNPKKEENTWIYFI